MQDSGRAILERAARHEPEALTQLVERAQLAVAVRAGAASAEGAARSVEQVVRRSLLERSAGSLDAQLFDIVGVIAEGRSAWCLDAEWYARLSEFPDFDVSNLSVGSRVDRVTHAIALREAALRGDYCCRAWSALRSLEYPIEEHRNVLVNSLAQPTVALLERYQASDDESAFDELYAHLEPQLEAVIRRAGLWVVQKTTLLDPGEVLQEVWVRAMDRLPSFDRSRRFTPWVIGIAKRTMLEMHRANVRHHRKRTGFDSKASRLHDSVAGPLSRFVEREDFDAFREKLATLEGRERKLVDYLLAEMPPSEQARLLGMEIGAVHKAHSRLREKLREWLQS